MFTRFDVLYSIATPLVYPFFAYKRLVKGKYRESGPAMLGKTLPTGEALKTFENGCIWIHAVSVGETVAAKSVAALICALRPDLPLVITTVTETGQAHARRLFPDAHVHYFPLDFSWNVQKFLDVFRPKIFIMMETELWPNFLSLAAKSGAQVFMLNGKLSDRSFPRYMKFRGLLSPVFDAITAFCMQTEQDAVKMRALSGRTDAVQVTGNCKFDALLPPLSDEEAQAFRTQYCLGDFARPLLVVGSTHPGEEEIILNAFAEARREVPALQMILSPRHPERFNSVVEMCGQHTANFKVSRATAPAMESPDILVLDKMGELAKIYGLGDVAVVAGSFGKVGGHNLLEAAAHSVPVVVGPNLRAQKELDRLFQGDDTGCVRCDGETLGLTLVRLFQNETLRKITGKQAYHTAIKNQGSASASAEIVKRYLNPQ
ncbi:TPA: hypothetical protein DDW35_07805 [Candidatus Sumerlaeota bacterium]|jgi:3-deoxy-D-manno-octulosonic-acid transferase|nr:hypothetical protein [Candidatus Sumerlaeota bacterium]